MTDDVRADARRLLQGLTRGPWKWYGDDHRVLEGLGGDPVVYEYDTEVLAVDHNGECGCRSACELEVTISSADAEFIAASPTLVAGLLAELDQEHDRALRLAIRAAGCEKAETERDAADATLARIQAVAADVDQDGGHSGPTLARHILNIIGGDE